MGLRLTIAANLAHYISKAEPPLNDEKALAARAGLHPKTIQRLRLPESNPNAGTGLGTLLRLADALDIDISLLLRRRNMAMFGHEQPPPQQGKIPARSAEDAQKMKKGRSE